MTSLALPLAALALGQGPVPAKPKLVAPTIVGVSMFKNGYSFLTREIPVSGTTADVIEIPQASVGTLWFTTDTGAPITSIESTSDVERVVSKSDIANIPQLLRANVGRTVTLDVRYPGLAESKTIEGKIVSTSDGLVNLERETTPGTTTRTTIRLDAVAEVRSSDPAFTFQTANAADVSRRFYRIVTAPGAKKVMMLSLERGLTWAPAYALDITDPKTMTFVARSTVLNDVFDLKGVNAKLITGFPNLPFSSILDPISANLSIDEWLGMVGGGEIAQPKAMARREMMTQNAAAPVAFDSAPDWSGVPEAAGEGESLGDLFFYNLPDLTLPKGGRQSRNLFRFESAYEHLYTWDIPAEYDPNSYQFRPIPPQADEVWHTIGFTNTSPQPLTTAVATVLQKGQLIGQNQLNYIAPGAKAEVRIGKALDIAPERLEEETGRERGAIKDRNNNPIFDLLTVKGTLVLTNRRSEAVRMRVTKSVVGEIFETNPTAKVTKSPGGLGQQNPTGKAIWTPTVPAGEKLTLTYSYRVYVRTNG